MYLVKDKAGKQFLVALYLDNGVEIPAIWKKHCFPGSVIAIMYATSHSFADGQHGVRVEELENIKMIPCSLDTLLRIGDDLKKPTTSGECASCKSPASLRCSKCSVVNYCGADCQLRDWKERHKLDCVAIQKVVEWKGRNWKRFNEYWMN
ncbi:hypothetical protein M413DRAFT_443324 [Hebeloma cylindrosporum]|uniref:MYND-type domain-containing protein n=1 Tax=Hebeloma cylindrosporum TaxID=76867 RepID=A0A0C3CKK2_HEBCY|nr:hypothetical protein M413DRAFT_443324 [Hebeloma cylindrosporum h7]